MLRSTPVLKEQTMNFFDLFRQQPDIHVRLEECRAQSGSVLLDVRTPQEYSQGHIPGSRNLPLQSIHGAAAFVPDKAAPVYVYCHSGVRSCQAVRELERMGYTKVTDLGGMMSYAGEVEFA